MVKELEFTKLYHFEGIDTFESLFLSKILGFHYNRKPVFMSNKRWAKYLGTSERQVTRIKTKFRDWGIIEGLTNRIKLIVNPDDIQSIIISKIKLKETSPAVSGSIPQSGNITGNNGDNGSHTVTTERHSGDDTRLVGGIIDNEKEKQKENKINNQIDNSSPIATVDSSTLSLDNFIYDTSINSVSKIDFDDSLLNIKSSILSYWYNCIDGKLISRYYLKLFNQKDYYSVLSRFFRFCIDKQLEPQRYLDVPIDNFIFIHNYPKLFCLNSGHTFG